MNSDFNLESGTGLASVLKGNVLKVPTNQREYKWDDEHVMDLLTDTANAKSNSRPAYFMGTIVLTKKDENEWEIADGQQRLATTATIFSVMRDIYLKMSEPNRARGIENDFLFWFDDEGQEIARLTLNADDNDFFYNRIILRPENRVDREAKLISHRRLDQAYKTIFKYFSDLKEQTGRGFLDELTLWKKYLLNNSKVLLLKVPDSKLAFVMFETLNDRGVKTSQVDLIKNYLFQEAGRRKDEAQRSWSAMRGIIESVGEDADDVVMEYLRALRDGPRKGNV